MYHYQLSESEQQFLRDLLTAEFSVPMRHVIAAASLLEKVMENAPEPDPVPDAALR
jgi:hypothetical protein